MFGPLDPLTLLAVYVGIPLFFIGLYVAFAGDDEVHTWNLRSLFKVLLGCSAAACFLISYRVWHRIFDPVITLSVALALLGSSALCNYRLRAAKPPPTS